MYMHIHRYIIGSPSIMHIHRYIIEISTFIGRMHILHYDIYQISLLNELLLNTFADPTFTDVILIA